MVIKWGLASGGGLNVGWLQGPVTVTGGTAVLQRRTLPMQQPVIGGDRYGATCRVVQCCAPFTRKHCCGAAFTMEPDRQPRPK